MKEFFIVCRQGYFSYYWWAYKIYLQITGKT